MSLIFSTKSLSGPQRRLTRVTHARCPYSRRVTADCGWQYLDVAWQPKVIGSPIGSLSVVSAASHRRARAGTPSGCSAGPGRASARTIRRTRQLTESGITDLLALPGSGRMRSARHPARAAAATTWRPATAGRHVLLSRPPRACHLTCGPPLSGRSGAPASRGGRFETAGSAW